MLRSIANLLGDLHTNDIAYCNLKGNDQHLKHALTGESDIDVLFDIRQKEKLKLILTMLGFKEFVAVRQKRYKDVYDFLTLDTQSGKIVHLHTYFGYTIGEPFLKGYQPDIAEHILTTRVYNRDYGLYCIQPELELTLLYIGETLKLRHRDHLQSFVTHNLALPAKAIYQHNWLRARTTQAAVENAVHVIFGDQPGIKRLVGSEFHRSTLKRMASAVKRALAKDRLYSPTHGLLLRWFREADLKIRRKLSQVFALPLLSLRMNPRGGTIVSLVENSTATRAALLDSAKNTFVKKIDVYSVSFQQRKADDRQKAGKHITSITGCLKAVLRAWGRWRKTKRIQSAKKRGALVICDLDPGHQNGPFNTGGPKLKDLLTSRNRILRYLARLESGILCRTANSFSPDLVCHFTSAGEPGCQTPATDPACEMGIGMAALKTCAATRSRLVKIDPEKTQAEKTDILIHEIWKEL